MSFNVSAATRIAAMKDRAIQKLKTGYEKHGTKLDRVGQGLATTTVAGTLGFVNNRFANNEEADAFTVLHAPVDLLLGVGLHGAAWYCGMQRKEGAANYLAAVGSGATAAAAYRFMAGVGKHGRETAERKEAGSQAPALGVAPLPPQLYSPGPTPQAPARVVASPQGQQFTIVQHP